jgi:hypothetical protein
MVLQNWSVRIGGFWAALSWIFAQRDLFRFLRLWLRNVRVAFFGASSH